MRRARGGRVSAAGPDRPRREPGCRARRRPGSGARSRRRSTVRTGARQAPSWNGEVRSRLMGAAPGAPDACERPLAAPSRDGAAHDPRSRGRRGRGADTAGTLACLVVKWNTSSWLSTPAGHTRAGNLRRCRFHHWLAGGSWVWGDQECPSGRRLNVKLLLSTSSPLACPRFGVAPPFLRDHDIWCCLDPATAAFARLFPGGRRQRRAPGAAASIRPQTARADGDRETPTRPGPGPARPTAGARAAPRPARDDARRRRAAPGPARG